MPAPFAAHSVARRFEQEVAELHAIIAAAAAPCGCSSDVRGGSFSPWCLEHGALAALFPATPKPHNHIGKPVLKKFA